MGNFSRDTYDPAKRYVSVRIEQGVPLVDADWNELSDVTRGEAYDGVAVAAGDVAERNGLMVGGGTNDFTLSAGRAVIGGRPVVVGTPMTYSTQRYRNAALAAADGVAVVPNLTLPFFFGRTDTVYLDVFEREVSSVEDGSLVNPAIGLQTSVRRKREAILRVAEGTTVVPPAPPGHGVMALATVRRPPGTAIPPNVIVDAKPYGEVQGARSLGLAPLFQGYSVQGGGASSAWTIERVLSGEGFHALRPNNATVAGVLPITLPDRSRLMSARVRGTSSGTLNLYVTRTQFGSTANDLLVQDSVPAGAFDRTLSVPQTGNHFVDGSSFGYLLDAVGFGLGQTIIYGVTITFDR